MNLQDYIKEFEGKKIKVEIAKKWQERVVGKLDNLGAEGAVQYLVSYGKGIGAEKCAQLAMMAMSQSKPEMAVIFWTKAYELQFGSLPEVGVSDIGNAPKLNIVTRATPYLPFLPESLQPGKLITMQPVDAKRTPEELIEDDDFIAQAKRDGNKYVIYAMPDRVIYQSRSLNLRGSPDVRIEKALKSLASKMGAFVIEAEIYFQSADGREHRTGAQAATWNDVIGSKSLPKTKCAVIGALYVNEEEKTSVWQQRRLVLGKLIATALSNIDDAFEPLSIAVNSEEKAALYEQQKSEGREGVVWSSKYVVYAKDKQAGQNYVRTKFLTELDVNIRGLTETTVSGKKFGAILIADDKGNDIGSVGTGFSREDELAIFDECTCKGHDVKIKIACQGFTENGKAFQARFLEML